MNHETEFVAKLPMPGETWRLKPGVSDDRDETPAIVCQIGSADREYDHEEHEWVDRGFDPDKVVFWVPTAKYKGTTFTLNRDSFLKRYEFDPAAQEKRDERIRLIGRELDSVNQASFLLENELRQIGDGSPTNPGATVALTSEDGVKMVDEIKRSVASIRNDVQRNREKMEAETQKMAAVARENAFAIKAKMHGMQAMMEAKTRALQKMVSGAQELVWTFDLYLGTKEQIEVLRDGQPADRNEKIAIRQLVLYMDEETALFSDEGGIDFKNIEEFDRWILEDPAHMVQVLPNIRGIVALKIRRKPKGYNTGHPVSDAALEELNKKTHFLIRNGERVFRISTELEVGETLTPRSDEFVKLFEKAVKKDGRETGEKTTIKPGDKKYMEVMERVGQTERHFLRVFLFLQGLLDRTTVFAPFEVPRVNVFDMMRQDQHIEFVRDAETGRQLADGRPSFEEWREGLNKKVEVGMRVIGVFKTYAGSGRDIVYFTHPVGMSKPDPDELHTVVGADNSFYGTPRLHINYERDLKKDPVYSREWHKRDDDPAPRIRLWFDRDHEMYLAYDLATVEDIEYYLRSRQNRHEYKTMFPILQRALAFKEKETKEEAPFRVALTGALMRDLGVDEETATKDVNDLVSWWKYKNKLHRALLSDDEKASRMILKEAARRARLKKEREESSEKHRETATAIKAQVPNALAIYHKDYNEYIVFVPENDRNIFVGEQLWRNTRQGLEMVTDDRWVTTNLRGMRNWYLLDSHSRWSEWKHDVDSDKMLTDPEWEQVYASGMLETENDWKDPKARGKGENSYQINRADNGEGEAIYVPLATYFKDGHYEHWIWSRKSHIPKKRLTGEWSEPNLVRVEIKAVIKKDRKIVADVDYSSMDFKYSPFIVEEKRARRHQSDEYPEPLWSNPSAITEFQKQQVAYEAAEKKKDILESSTYPLVKQVEKAMRDAYLVGVRAKFDADYGAEDLWEGHLKTIKIPEFKAPGFSQAVDYVAETGVNFVGMTVGEVMEKAKSLGWKGEMEPTRFNRNESTIYTLPLDYVFVSEPEEEDEEDTPEISEDD